MARASGNVGKEVRVTPWPCHICPLKYFGRPGDLRRHIKDLHSGKKDYECLKCGKQFSQNSGLKTHMNTHDGRKPYKCGHLTCTKRFADPSSCTRHRKEVHTRTEKYTCPQCGREIKRTSSFTKHLQDKHQADPHTLNIEQYRPSPVILFQKALPPKKKKSAPRYDSFTGVPEPLSFPGEPSLYRSDPPITSDFPHPSERDSDDTRRYYDQLGVIDYSSSGMPEAHFVHYQYDENDLSLHPPLPRYESINYPPLPRYSFYPPQPVVTPSMVSGMHHSTNSTPGPASPPYLSYSVSPSPTPSGHQIGTPHMLSSSMSSPLKGGPAISMPTPVRMPAPMFTVASSRPRSPAYDMHVPDFQDHLVNGYYYYDRNNKPLYL